MGIDDMRILAPRRQRSARQHRGGDGDECLRPDRALAVGSEDHRAPAPRGWSSPAEARDPRSRGRLRRRLHRRVPVAADRRTAPECGPPSGGARSWRGRRAVRGLPAFGDPCGTARLRSDQRAMVAGAEGLRHGRALVARGDSGRVEESDRNLHPVALRAHHLGVLGGRAEAQAAVTAHLDAHVVDALRAGDQVLMVPELEDAVLVHELRCRDARAEDVGPAFGADLQEDILLLGVDVRHARAGEDGAQPQPAGHPASADATALQLHGETLDVARAAGRILEVSQAVAVVVDAVATDLDQGRRAVRQRGVLAGTSGAEILRAGVLVVAVGGRRAGDAARDGSVAADAGTAGLGGAGVLVVAIGGGDAGCAAGDGGVVADAGVAGLGGAGVLIVAVRRGSARLAAGDGGVVADAGVARFGGAGVLVVAVGRGRARLAAGDGGVVAGAGVAGLGGAGVLVVAVGRDRAGLAAGDGGVVAGAVVAGVGGAGVLVVAVCGGGAGRAAGEGGVVADAIAGVGGAGVLVVAVGGGGAERAAGGGGAGALRAPVADVVDGAVVAVVAGSVGRLEGVRRAVHARPRAGLGRVACVGRGVADRTRVGGWVNAPAAPVALIRAAHVAVVLARGAARGRRAGARSGLTAVPGGAPSAVVARGPVGHGRAGAVAGLAGVGAGAGVLIVAGRPVGDLGADAHPTLAGIAAGAGVAVVTGRRVGQRHADAHPTLAGVLGGAGVAVVARGALRLRGAGADAAVAGVA